MLTTPIPFWFEVMKLLVPLAVALIALWAKEWYVTRNERIALMRLLSKNLATELGMLPDNIAEFIKIPKKLEKEGFCIFVSQMTEWYFPTAARLAQLDYTNVFIYSNFSSRAKHVEASSLNLQGLLNSAMSASEEEKSLYQKAVAKNARALQRDFISYAEACHEVLKALAHQTETSSDILASTEVNLAKAKELLESSREGLDSVKSQDH